MGFDKALANVAGKPLAMRVAERLGVCCGTVGLVGAPDKYRALGLPVAADSFPGCGPLAGIEAALGATAAEQNLIVACDMPALAPEFLEELFAAAEKGADCVVPQHPDDRLEPLCAVYGRSCHGVVREAIQAGVRRVIDWLRILEERGFAVRYVQAPSSEPFANLNTPEDLRQYNLRKYADG
jgi:molybdopterin-guanine dinucleotide biosynthesis protein A